MIEVRKLVKDYGPRRALHGINFSVPAGAVVGFLGPNGAGKSTTMRILTTFIAASGGDAVIDGLRVDEQPVKVREKLGYMPETLALYPEMRVEEYLRFRAGIKGIKKAAAEVDAVLRRAELTDRRRSLIGSLSKGYKQRVGLADALLGSPPILILDEPTVGLDPNQLQRVRELIVELGKEHTILLSTHILSEVEAVASRAIIIAGGKIKADDTLENLQQSLAGRSRLILGAAGDGAALKELAGVLPDVHSSEPLEAAEGECRLALSVAAGKDLRAKAFQAAKERNLNLLELKAESYSLDEVFRHLTRTSELEANVTEAEAEAKSEGIFDMGKH
jgi:ABC-2 type transport system ATP-binding protein